jgi:hypothetical protein
MIKSLNKEEDDDGDDDDDDDEEDEDDDEGMTLFIKNYNKFMAKRRALKGNKGENPRTRS